MFIRINPRSSTPLYEQVMEQVKELIAKGILESGEQLPSVRDLASQIVLNPNTVSKAYKELERNGVIVTIRGKGTFVADASDRKLDLKQLEQLRQQLQRLVIEATYAGIKKEELTQWIEEEFQTLKGEGDRNAD
ncbi:GntR family transcriptional regulator [Halalkalibacter nanhaiisediminis]|uniref:Transcriptional regulator, GntR family n=1 Tax=Halalkalibacter nanhaiisediminis TaxID=688079 RepID=A0A562QM63_9BACI|nr:GntR family transcriptional regulator [Halalkalibacter nanhaiisediminis]TWI57842.1 transcriptional regulator, GntR family [Halalkalibacter nanhaiisediminis]